MIYLIGWRSNGRGEWFQIHRINPFLFYSVGESVNGSSVVTFMISALESVLK